MWKIMVASAILILSIGFAYWSNSVRGSESSSLMFEGGMPYSCLDGYDWKSARNSDVSFSNIDEWGTFRPGTYFSLMTKSFPLHLAAGLAWGDSRNFRHDFTSNDNVHASWLRHNGKTFGEQFVIDAKLQTSFSTTFQTSFSPKSDLLWAVLIEIDEIHAPLNFMFYLGSFGSSSNRNASLFSYSEGNLPSNNDSQLFSTVFCRQKGDMAMSNIMSDMSPEISFHSLQDVSEVASRIKSELTRRQTSTNRKNDATNLALVTVRQLSSDSCNEDEILSLLFVLMKKDVHVDETQIWNELQSQLLVSRSSFDDRLDVSFLSTIHENIKPPLVEEGQESEEKMIMYEKLVMLRQFVSESVSNIAGGIGFFHGRPKIHGMNSSMTPELSLLTATPSRTSFPRGFLWDEGFHQLVLSKWDLQLSLDIMEQYFASMSFVSRNKSSCVGSWIPREIILGKESEKRVPSEFIDQYIHISNPPTLIVLSLTSILRSARTSMATENALLRFLKRNIEYLDSFSMNFMYALKNHEVFTDSASCNATTSSDEPSGNANDLMHWNMFWSDKVTKDFSRSLLSGFSWKSTLSRNPNSVLDDKLLHNNLMGSGLDDFPRASDPQLPYICKKKDDCVANENYREMHVDAFSWVAALVHSMKSVHDFMIRNDNQLILKNNVSYSIIMSEFYSKLTDMLLKPSLGINLLDKLHWNEETLSYADFGQNDENATVESYTLFRCQSTKPNVVKSDSEAYFAPKENIKTSDSYVLSETLTKFLDLQSKLKATGSADDNVALFAKLDRLVGGDCCSSNNCNLYNSFTCLCHDSEFPFPQHPVNGHDNRPVAKLKLTRTMDGIKQSHVPRVGYVNLVPFMLRLISVDSKEILHNLDLIESGRKELLEMTLSKVPGSPHGLWSPAGIRSLSADDKFYGIGNNPDDLPYWRGYIWINMNYLIADALRHYSHEANSRRMHEIDLFESDRWKAIEIRCLDLYHELKRNIIATLFSEYLETGELWEQYDDLTKRGRRGHPFNGWTSLVALLVDPEDISYGIAKQEEEVVEEVVPVCALTPKFAPL